MENNICYQSLSWMPGNNYANRVIVCAANKYITVTGEELIIPCVRHANPILTEQVKMLISLGVLKQGWCLPENQGFVDQYCNWWSREEAYKIALHNNQIDHDRNGSTTELFSEGLY